jgi:16S rRNA C967 or C1407 C5-methylase (RsmB/RsmF family)
MGNCKRSRLSAVFEQFMSLHSKMISVLVIHISNNDHCPPLIVESSTAQIPRYVRVNAALWTTDDAIKHFTEAGYLQGDPFESMWVNTLISECGSTLIDGSSKNFAVDKHVPDLLLFSPAIRLQEDVLCTSGKIILQDKASCFPALVLAPPSSEDAVVIDATSAPGNKTSHISALMNGKGKVGLHLLGDIAILRASYPRRFLPLNAIGKDLVL